MLSTLAAWAVSVSCQRVKLLPCRTLCLRVERDPDEAMPKGRVSSGEVDKYPIKRMRDLRAIFGFPHIKFGLVLHLTCKKSGKRHEYIKRIGGKIKHVSLLCANIWVESWRVIHSCVACWTNRSDGAHPSPDRSLLFRIKKKSLVCMWPWSNNLFNFDHRFTGVREKWLNAQPPAEQWVKICNYFYIYRENLRVK